MKKPKLNFLERMLFHVSPRAAARRFFARQSVEYYLRKYDSAGSGRRWNGLTATSSDAETEVAGGLVSSRNRARALVRNNWIAGRCVDAIISNTVGHGIELSIENKKATRLWKDWARTVSIDVNNELDFFGLQQLALGTIVESGDVLVRKVRSPGYKVPLKIQLLEGDYIDTTKNERKSSQGISVRNGIEFDSDGMVSAYYLYDEHPGSIYPLGLGRASSSRHPISEVRLVYRKQRLGQVRGMTWLSRAMLKIRDLDDYDDAQLFRQKIAACFAGFMETNEMPLNTSTNEADEDPISEKLEPGIIEVLPPGKKMTFSSPPGVGSDYGPFVTRQLQSVASSVGITYEALTADYSNVNFSSGRMGWIEMHRNIEMWRWGMFVPMLCDVVWEWFVEAAEVAGLLDASRLKVPVWTPPHREMIDPVKETAALKDKVRSGFMSYSESLREMGKDPDAHMAEMAEDFRKLDRLSLTIEADPRFNSKTDVSLSAESSKKGLE